MSKYFISAHDVATPADIFFYLDKTGKYVVRPRYADLACPACKKIDELEALSRGLDDQIVITTKRNIFPSFEDIKIVDGRTRDILESIDGVEISFFAFPKSPHYYVAMPKTLIQPIPGDEAYRFFKPCKACSRFEQIVFGAGIPTISEGIMFGAIRMESRLAMAPLWFADASIVDQFKAVKPPLAKLVVETKEIAVPPS